MSERAGRGGEGMLVGQQPATEDLTACRAAPSERPASPRPAARPAEPRRASRAEQAEPSEPGRASQAEQAGPSEPGRAEPPSLAAAVPDSHSGWMTRLSGSPDGANAGLRGRDRRDVAVTNRRDALA